MLKDGIQVENLSKNYEGHWALKGLSFEVHPGECLGLLGSNGAGKSTTLRILTGQTQPTQGQVRVLGLDPSLNPKQVHKHIGYVPDNQCLYDELTTLQNVSIFCELFGEPAQKSEKILERLGLEGRRQQRVKDLSKGLRQRVLIARALVHHPSLIILDEPTTGLDPSSADGIYSLLEELKSQGTTVLITTHLMNDVERLCDRVVFIDRGQIVESGSPKDLKRKYSKPQMQVLYKDPKGEETLGVFAQTPEGFAQLNAFAKNHQIISVHSHEAKLEDIFIELLEST